MAGIQRFPLGGLIPQPTHDPCTHPLTWTVIAVFTLNTLLGFIGPRMRRLESKTTRPLADLDPQGGSIQSCGSTTTHYSIGPDNSLGSLSVRG